MRPFLKAFTHHPWLAGGFIAAAVVTLFFATRMIFFTVYWSDPAHRDQVLQGWMTPGYVAHSWSVPRPVIAETLGDIADVSKGKTLDQIASDTGEPLQDLIVRIETAIAGHRSAHD